MYFGSIVHANNNEKEAKSGDNKLKVINNENNKIAKDLLQNDGTEHL